MEGGRGEAWRGKGGGGRGKGRWKGKGEKGKGTGDKGGGEGENERGEWGSEYVARQNFRILRRRQWEPNSISLLYL